MVGVNSFLHRFGTVAIFATLFAAIHVNAEKGCVFDSEHASDLDLKCNDAKNSWTVSEAKKESANKKIFILSPGDGCLKVKRLVNLNSTTPVALKFFQDADKDDSGKITLRLIPKEGNCLEEECVWHVESDPVFKPKDWIRAEHRFPLKSSKDYYIQLQVENIKGKVLLDRIVLPSADAGRCHEVSSKELNDETSINLPDPLVSAGTNGTNDCNLVELSKNLMLTSASVLTLNNLLN